MSALVLCRIESESRSVVRQRQIIVDGLRHVNIVNRILFCLKEFCNPVSRRSSVVASDSDKQLHVVLLEKLEVEIFLEILIGRLETAHLQVGTTSVEIRICLEEIDVFSARMIVEKSGVAFVQANYPVTVRKECFRDRENNRVHARCRAAAAENDDRIFHNNLELFN